MPERPSSMSLPYAVATSCGAASSPTFQIFAANWSRRSRNLDVRIIVIGAGAIGGYIGGKLADHHDVTLVGRPPLVAAINAHGLKIVEPKSERWVRTVHAVDKIEAAFQNIDRFDLALFTVKNYDTATAIEQ